MKEKILQQSIALFERNGFSETSIQDIVTTLQVTKGTFYYYFTSKEQLLTQIHLQYIDSILEKQRHIIDDPDKTWKEKLFDVVHMLIQQIEAQGASARIFFRELINIKGAFLDELLTKRDQFRFTFQYLIEQGIENGEFRSDLPADMMTFAVLGACNWSYMWFKPEGPVPDSEVAHTFVEMFLNGMKK
ncbi:TetR/AcrR family transcriptional regulator [Aneurinibacillus sp. REN35]|uniref:TetR/AcrR family transcriptional regulator n=1 Tax=Aneurinibacillus sp. REN35 TaxID=3237286 RepID=UPI003527A43B